MMTVVQILSLETGKFLNSPTSSVLGLVLRGKVLVLREESVVISLKYKAVKCNIKVENGINFD